VSTPYNPFPIGGDLKQISIVRRGLLLREHALACPIDLKAIDDALPSRLLQTHANGMPDRWLRLM